MINTNKHIAWLLNLIVAVFILSGAVYLLEVPTVETFMQFCQHVLGLILVYFSFDLKLFKGEY